MAAKKSTVAPVVITGNVRVGNRWVPATQTGDRITYVSNGNDVHSELARTFRANGLAAPVNVPKLAAPAPVVEPTPVAKPKRTPAAVTKVTTPEPLPVNGKPVTVKPAPKVITPAEAKAKVASGTKPRAKVAAVAQPVAGWVRLMGRQHEAFRAHDGVVTSKNDKIMPKHVAATFTTVQEAPVKAASKAVAAPKAESKATAPAKRVPAGSKAAAKPAGKAAAKVAKVPAKAAPKVTIPKPAKLPSDFADYLVPLVKIATSKKTDAAVFAEAGNENSETMSNIEGAVLAIGYALTRTVVPAWQAANPEGDAALQHHIDTVLKGVEAYEPVLASDLLESVNALLALDGAKDMKATAKWSIAKRGLDRYLTWATSAYPAGMAI